MPLLDSEKGGEEMETEDGYQQGNKIASLESHISRRDSPSCDQKEDSTETNGKSAGQVEDSGFSFSLDLGPSILDDVLQVMDNLYD